MGDVKLSFFDPGDGPAKLSLTPDIVPCCETDERANARCPIRDFNGKASLTNDELAGKTNTTQHANKKLLGLIAG